MNRGKGTLGEVDQEEEDLLDYLATKKAKVPATVEPNTKVQELKKKVEAMSSMLKGIGEEELNYEELGLEDRLLYGFKIPELNKFNQTKIPKLICDNLSLSWVL